MNGEFFVRLLIRIKFLLKGKIYRVPRGCISSGCGENLNIGRDVSFGGNVFLFGTSLIEIGDNSMVAYGVVIHTSTHDYNVHPMRCKRIDRPVKIGSNVWIGINAIILPGVIIGNHAVIGAGSVVNANVPAGAIVVGNPARIIKFRDKKVYLESREVSLEEYIIEKKGYLDHDCKNA